MRPITASDLMNSDVLTVGEEMTVHAAAAFLLDNEISGAPVVDGGGRLVGVVSLVDLVETDDEGGELEGADFLARDDEIIVDEADLEDLDDAELAVREVMTTEIHSVDEDATVSEVAMKMLKEHLHRLLVLRDGRVVGIISTSDLLGLLVEDG